MGEQACKTGARSCALFTRVARSCWLAEVDMVGLLFDRRAKLVCAGLWGVSWLAVAALLLLPLGGVLVPGGSDLIGHFLVYAAIAFAAVGFARAPAQLAWLAFVTIGLGVTLEYAQGFLPYRSSEIADGVANTLGGLAGYAAALLFLYFVIRPAEHQLGLAPRHFDPGCSAERHGRSFRGRRGIKLPG
jgi:VanZ like family